MTPPYYTYAHSQTVAAGDGCPTGGSAPSGVAFYPTGGGNYPSTYAGALFFADYSRECIWAMRAGTNGLPDPASIIPFSSTVSGPVDLEIGPDQDLYYVDLTGGTVRRFHYSSGNQPPAAVVTATPVSGNAPLQVTFDATGSTDPDPGDILSYQWDFTNDGTVDATGATASFTYTSRRYVHRAVAGRRHRRLQRHQDGADQGGYQRAGAGDRHAHHGAQLAGGRRRSPSPGTPPTRRRATWRRRPCTGS